MSDVIEKMENAACLCHRDSPSHIVGVDMDAAARVLIEDMKLWAMENRKDPTFVPSYAKSRGIE